MIYYLYILLCSNDSYYIGYTTDLERRYQEHRDGSDKCKYTRSFPPRKIAASWELDMSRSEIYKLEHRIKRCTRKQKTELINRPNSIDHYLQEIV